MTGLYLRTDLTAELAQTVESGQPPPLDIGQRIRDSLKREDENAAAAGEILKRVASAAQVDCAFRIVSGDTAWDMIIEARHADLVVVGPWDPLRKGHAFAVDIVLGAGVPVLVVPAKVKRSRIGERVLVAWNGSRESSTALRNALPILTPDALLEIRSARYKHDRNGVLDLRGYLERHACRMNVKTIDDDGRSIPKWLVSEAVEADCDLIVMGVYGHARQRDFVLSDVSEHMLQTAPLPLLISH